MNRLRRNIPSFISSVIQGAVVPLALAAVADAAVVVGKIPGSFNVTQTGEATYTIPINLPRGPGGMQPHLSLFYSHRGGSGLAGQGWTIGGLSRITRCPKTLAQDGEIRGVQYGYQDRFCLDGQRLVAISGAYGADGTEYRTEIETFRKIVSHGTQGNGPVSFTVTDRNGIRHKYGNEQGSSLTDPATNSHKFWYRYRSVDPYENQIDYYYYANGGEFNLDWISWTRNDYQGLIARYRATFDMEDRPVSDQREGYNFGALWSKTRRIEKIRVEYVHDAQTIETVAEYSLDYSTGASGRSQLDSVTLCKNLDCLPATEFEWQDTVPGWASATSSGQSSSGHTYPLDGDFNYDGQRDLYVVKNGEWHVLTASAGDFAAPIDTNKAATNALHTMPLDFNGDRKTDLLVPASDGNWHVYLSTGTAFTDIDTGVAATTYTTAHAQDVDGDGLDDLLYKSGSSIYLRKSDGSTLGAATVVLNSSATSFVGSSLTSSDYQMDFDGDGRGDIITYHFEWQGTRRNRSRCSTGRCMYSTGQPTHSFTGSTTISHDRSRSTVTAWTTSSTSIRHQTGIQQ